MRSVVLSALLALSLPTLARAADGGPEQTAPVGIWELAASHPLPLSTEVALSAGGLLVVSDLKRDVFGVRPDSGLVVWERRLASDEIRGIWALDAGQGKGELVLVAGDALSAFRADVGARLWSRELGCSRGLCASRVVFAGTVDGVGEDAIYVAEGGLVQDALNRLDPTTGEPMWPTAAAVRHARKVVVAPAFVAAEESQSPFNVVFLHPSDGRELGRWERGSIGATQPSSVLFVDGGRLISVDLRPEGGGLATVHVVRPDGELLTERQVPRAVGIANVPTMAAVTPRGLVIATPDPGARQTHLSIVRLEAPWTARTEVVRSAKPAIPGPRDVAFVWADSEGVRAVTLGAALNERKINGFLPALGLAEHADADLVAVVEGRSARAAPGGVGIVTLDAASGQLHGFGVAELGDDLVHAAIVRGDLVLVARAASGDKLHRLALVPWKDALERLRSARSKGQDIGPIVGRLGRFYPVAAAVGVAGGDTGVDGGGVVIDGAGGGAAALPSEDLALVEALRETWRGGDALGTLQAMQTLVEQAPERSERRRGLLSAFAELGLDLVLGPGVAPRGEALMSLVALLRLAEWEAKAAPLPRETSAIYAAVAALTDEPLAGADLLERVPADTLADDSRAELARRALHLLRKSAGPLRTDTSRQMLVSGLRFFRHLDVVLGAEAANATELLDRAALDLDAAAQLERLLIAAEGPRAAKKGPGPATCQLACEAALEVCGDGVAGKVVACQDRCQRTGAVRLSNAGRPTGDPRWFCR